MRSFHGLSAPDTEAASAWSAARSSTVSNASPQVKSLTIDVFTEGGVVLRSSRSPTTRPSATPAVELNTNTAQAWAVMFLPSSKLYRRVLGVDAYGVAGTQPVVRTLTVKPPSGPLPAPVLEFPANGATVTQGQQVAFFWQPVNGAASYELQVADNASFTPPSLVLDRQPQGNQVDTSTLPAGSLFWRVRVMDSLGNPGAWSTTFQLTVTASGG